MGSLVTVTNLVIGTQPLEEVEVWSNDLMLAPLLFEPSSPILAAADDDGAKTVVSCRVINKVEVMVEVEMDSWVDAVAADPEAEKDEAALVTVEMVS